MKTTKTTTETIVGRLNLTAPDTFRTMTARDREAAAARVGALVDVARAMRWIAQIMSTGATDAAPIAACDLPNGAGPDWSELVAIAERAIAAATHDDATDYKMLRNEYNANNSVILAILRATAGRPMTRGERDALDSARAKEAYLLDAIRKTIPRATILVKLSHAPNPDISGGYWQEGNPDAPQGWVAGESLSDCSRLCREYINAQGLGGGNWTGGAIVIVDAQDDPNAARPVALVSYNGRAHLVD